MSSRVLIFLDRFRWDLQNTAFINQKNRLILVRKIFRFVKISCFISVANIIFNFTFFRRDAGAAELARLESVCA